jgi:hypothetical protein
MADELLLNFSGSRTAMNKFLLFIKKKKKRCIGVMSYSPSMNLLEILKQTKSRIFFQK